MGCRNRLLQQVALAPFLSHVFESNATKWTRLSVSVLLGLLVINGWPIAISRMLALLIM